MKTSLTLLLLTLTILSCDNNGENDYDASGTFEADEIIISAEVAGTIQEFEIAEGATVEKGQLLGWIDSTQLHLKKKATPCADKRDPFKASPDRNAACFLPCAA